MTTGSARSRRSRCRATCRRTSPRKRSSCRKEAVSQKLEAGSREWGIGSRRGGACSARFHVLEQRRLFVPPVCILSYGEVAFSAVCIPQGEQVAFPSGDGFRRSESKHPPGEGGCLALKRGAYW